MLSRNIRRLGSLDSLSAQPSLHHHFIKVASSKKKGAQHILFLNLHILASSPTVWSALQCKLLEVVRPPLCAISYAGWD